MGRKDKLVEEIVELIENYYPKIEALSDYEDDEYNLFKSLFLKKLNPKEIKEEIIQGVVEESRTGIFWNKNTPYPVKNIRAMTEFR